ncbi:hypothetical protein M427DRAFT_53853 [Gonapodya prolifera JEL478]|uniref:Uncharacterized protein n=1 Tax=Gonapodya prolifera (strain JEL478) TaxID=1344416 RepID=A0A139AP10_GONPJ|nr:hypothetical protein M427DRAFT_53853 [Gonapodya prolifera JEL478]|eukprot:KXS18480.1 hypothetical protein M427DRAFT_53853 [Gonapodya prolifera JEL478]
MPCSLKFYLQRDHQNLVRMWDNAFPSLWYVWGEGSHRDIDDGQPFPETFEVVFGTSGSSLTWARGIEMLVERLRKTRKCEYVFTHDDGEDSS